MYNFLNQMTRFNKNVNNFIVSTLNHNLFLVLNPTFLTLEKFIIQLDKIVHTHFHSTTTDSTIQPTLATLN